MLTITQYTTDMIDYIIITCKCQQNIYVNLFKCFGSLVCFNNVSCKQASSLGGGGLIAV